MLDGGHVEESIELKGNVLCDVPVYIPAFQLMHRPLGDKSIKAVCRECTASCMQWSQHRKSDVLQLGLHRDAHVICNGPNYCYRAICKNNC